MFKCFYLFFLGDNENMIYTPHITTNQKSIPTLDDNEAIEDEIKYLLRCILSKYRL